RRGVDREALGPRPGPVERVDLIGLPACAPYRLKPVEHGLVGDGGGARALVGIGHGQTLLSAPVRPHTINTAAGTTGRGTRAERPWRHPGRIGSAADIAWQEGCTRTRPPPAQPRRSSGRSPRNSACATIRSPARWTFSTAGPPSRSSPGTARRPP